MQSGVRVASGAFTVHGQGCRGPLKGPWQESRGQCPRKLLGFSTFETSGRAILQGYMTQLLTAENIIIPNFLQVLCMNLIKLTIFSILTHPFRI